MKYIHHLALALFATFLAVAGSVSTHAALPARPPNIIVILADDAGYADFGFQSGGIHGDFAVLTPHIDSIASGGVHFSNAYVSAPVCCPSRAGLLTGRYQQRYGMEQNISSEPNAGLPTTEKTIANSLKALGYRTYALGKWHLGQDLLEHHPNQRGFDQFYGFLSGARTYFQFSGADNASKLQRNGVFLTETPGQYVTDLFGAAAAAYIDAHTTHYSGQPFFMYLAFNSVHAPLEADLVRLADPRIRGITVPNRKTLAAMTIALDDAVGVVLAKLAERGLTNNTLIVFTNDNGGPEDNESLLAPNWSDNGSLRGGKTQLYEGGIRVPFAIQWPSGIAPSLVGGTLSDPITTLDLLPTFVAAASGSLLAGQATDGMSLLPRLTGASPTPMQRRHFWRIGNQSAVRQGDWKLYQNISAGRPELYNLAADLGETYDLAATMPGKVAELKAALTVWEGEMVAPIWGGGAPAFSSTNLVRNPSASGYELEKTGAGYSYMVDDLRDPLSLLENWELEWTMESVSKTGYARNGSIVLGDRLNAGRLISISLTFSSGAVSIAELQNNAATSGTWPAIAADTVNEFRLKFSAATHTLTFRYGTNTLWHVLTGTYDHDVLDYGGYALQSSALTRFSPITRHITPRAPVSPTWAGMKVRRDYAPGTYDINGNYMGGTELMAIAAHQGKLFAANGYWNDLPGRDPAPGPAILVKDSATAPWRQEYGFGHAFLRVETLREVTVTTDKNGVPLNPPVTLLLAGASDSGPFPRQLGVWVRDDVSGSWTKTVIVTNTSGYTATRVLLDHVDSITGIHHLFACTGDANTRVFRGGYNAATGLIDWNTTPEITGSERILSGGELNGWLYVCIGSDGNLSNNIGGIFWRQDGPSPQWKFVCEWPLNGTKNPDIRGFTAVPHPMGFDYDVALVTLESFGKVYCIDPVGGDPRNGHIVTEELNIQSFLGDEWNGGASIGFPTLSAYNDMPEFIDPATRQTVNLIGLGVVHPPGYGTPEGNSAYFLIRHRDASYEWARVFDSAFSTSTLKATRTLRLSPFPEDAGLTMFFGGYDAASQTGPVWHNTAWLYRGTLPAAKTSRRR